MNAPQKAPKAKDSKPTGIIAIHGREYQTVAYRVSLFREQHPDYSLTTSVIERDPQCVVMQATIADADGRVLATGHAEEYRSSSQINKTSALENAETSAIGRALAALGLGGTEFATANEVQNAIHQQDNPTAGEPKREKPVKLDGPYTSKTALWAAVKAFVHSCNGFSTNDELLPFLDTPDNLALIEQCKRDAPALWSEGLPELPEYEPLEIFIARKRREFDEVESIHDKSGAKYVRAG